MNEILENDESVIGGFYYMFATEEKDVDGDEGIALQSAIVGHAKTLTYGMKVDENFDNMMELHAMDALGDILEKLKDSNEEDVR